MVQNLCWYRFKIFIGIDFYIDCNGVDNNDEVENDNIFDEIEKESLVKKEEVKKISADDISLVDNMFDNWDEGGF